MCASLIHVTYTESKNIHKTLDVHTDIGTSLQHSAKPKPLSFPPQL